MSLFFGFFELEANGAVFCQCVDGNGSPVVPDAPPEYSIYDADQSSPLLANQAMTGPIDSQTGFYSDDPSLPSANGFEHGGAYYVRGTYSVATVPKTFDGTLIVT